MRTRIYRYFLKTSYIIVCFYLFFILNSCKTIINPDIPSPTTNNNKANQVSITGTIIDALTGTQLQNATVKLIYVTGTQIKQTDSKGAFSAQITMDSSSNISLIISLSGYINDTATVFGKLGSTINLSTIGITPTTKPFSGSGPAAAISVFSQSSSVIGVKGSGAIENGTITLQVVDSLGHALSIQHSVSVLFILAASPGGGEYLSPDSTYTDSLGQVTCNIFSGTKAGVVQIIGKIILGNKTISSTPVVYTISGGLPDQNHFSVASQFLNFAGYDIYGLTNQITAYVGDKYGNPARLGTPVYFSTTGGIIQGSALSNNLSEATVQLVSAAPKPVHWLLGKGFGTVYVKTADENLNTIWDSTVVLFSGVPVVSITPTTFVIQNRGTQQFDYYVHDENGNPLASGTTLSVVVTGDAVDASGDVNVTLPDVQTGWTHFTFILSDADTNVSYKPVEVVVNVSGPNGQGSAKSNGYKY
jgi:hypothetical protein